jgi:hypothetical protein
MCKVSLIFDKFFSVQLATMCFRARFVPQAKQEQRGTRSSRWNRTEQLIDPSLFYFFRLWKAHNFDCRGIHAQIFLEIQYFKKDVGHDGQAPTPTALPTTAGPDNQPMGRHYW